MSVRAEASPPNAGQCFGEGFGRPTRERVVLDQLLHNASVVADKSSRQLAEEYVFSLP